jgi:hypothetical protein
MTTRYNQIALLLRAAHPAREREHSGELAEWLKAAVC